MRLSVVAHPDAKMAYKNSVFLNPKDHAQLTAHLPLTQVNARVNVEVLGKVFPCLSSDQVAPGTVALGLLQRGYAQAMLDQQVDVSPFQTPQSEPFILSELQLRISSLSRNQKSLEVQAEELQNELKMSLNNFVIGMGMKLAHLYKASQVIQLEVCALKYSTLNSGASSSETAPRFSFEPEKGLYVDKVTELKFIKTEGVTIKGQIQERSANKLLEVNFEQLGVGGLDNEFSEIFRRAFASRVYPPDVVANMGLNHVRGLLLYGPPGCGKTLIARQISKALQAGSAEDKKREPKVVNGPEILSKFVGETEKNLCDLFADAEADRDEFGDESELHVIIFDEIDAIAKKRGSTRDGTGVHDSLVNQLLSKIDGVDALNNILLIGMTNRLDMLDPALLRPGRFEIQVEISLPDEQGRVQILNIHTAKMRKAGYLSSDVSIPSLAERTKNFTGAEIEGLVKGAASFAFQRQVNFGVGDLRKAVNAKNLLVCQEDFDSALAECKPQFGASEAEDEMRKYLGSGIIPFSEKFENVAKMLSELAKESASDNNPNLSSLSLVSVLLCGEPGSGKTALAAKIAYESGFPLVRVLSPDKLIGYSEQSKSSYIADIFDEAYKSEKSLILLEDIERIIDYSRIGPRYSLQVLQTLLILVRKPPPKLGRRLFIIGTTSVPEQIEQLDLVSVFNITLHVPQIETTEEVLKVVRSIITSPSSEADIQTIARTCILPISVKKLLLALDMAQRDGKLDGERFAEFLAVT